MTWEKRNFFETRYFSLNRALLVFLGLWPYSDFKTQFIRRTFIFSVICVAIFCQVAKLFTSPWTLNLLCQILPFLLICIATLIRYFVYCIKHEKTKELLDSMKCSWDNLESKEEAIIMENTFKEGQLFTVYWALSIFTVTSIYPLLSTTPIILDFLAPLNETRPRQLPFLIECFYDQEKYFYLALLSMSLSAVTITSAMIATKITYVAHVLHACGMFNIASYRLQYVFDHREDHTVDDLYITRKRIFQSVSYHQKAIKLVISINEYYEWPDLCNIIVIAIVISFSLYCIRMFVGEWDHMAKATIVAVSELFTLFVFLYPGQMLIKCGSQIFQSAYFSQWYIASPRAQKLLLLIIQRGASPAVIVLGKLATASMDTYARVLQSCLSYFTVLCSFQ